MTQRHVIPKSWYVSSGILTLFSLLMTQLALFDVLGYESSFALGLIAVPVSWFWGLARAETEAPILRTMGLTLAQYIAPLGVLSGNGFFVQNCNFEHGLLFFVSLPLSSALYVTLLAYTVGRLSDVLNLSRVLRITGFTLIFFSPLIAESHQFLTEPTIFFFNHAWGWYSGSLYDEGRVPDIRLALFRLGTAMRFVGLLTALYIVRRGTLQRILGGVMVVCASWTGEHILGQDAGYQIDRQAIEEILSDTVIMDGLIIHLDPSVNQSKRDAIVTEHAYRMDALKKLSPGLEALPPIRSYVYRSAQQKGRLMGGEKTMFAKPWLREIHIHGYGTPHRILGHELVHALLQPRADHPLGIPVAYGVIPLMGWVEGFAEAFTPPRTSYDIHTNARWLQERDRLPKLKPLLSPWTFWKTSPTVAYPVMGSFIDFILDTYGERSYEVYRDGDIERALGTDIEVLESEWHAFLKTITLDDVTQRGAAKRLRRKSIFDRPCAHVIAALRQSAYDATDTEAPVIYKEICDLLPGDARATFDYARSLAKAEEWTMFRDIVDELEQGLGLSESQQGTLLALEAEHAWKESRFERSRELFEDANRLHIGNAAARLRWVAVRILKSDLPTNALQSWYSYLFGTMNLEDALNLFETSKDSSLDEATLAYLHGRRLFVAKRWAESGRLLASASFEEPMIEAERLRLLRQVAIKEDGPAVAEHYHQLYLETLRTSGAKARADDAWKSAQFARGYQRLATD